MKEHLLFNLAGGCSAAEVTAGCLESAGSSMWFCGQVGLVIRNLRIALVAPRYGNFSNSSGVHNPLRPATAARISFTLSGETAGALLPHSERT